MQRHRLNARHRRQRRPHDLQRRDRRWPPTPAALVDRMNLLLLTAGCHCLRPDVGDAAGRASSPAINAITVPASNGSNQAQIDTARLNRVKTAIFFSMISPEYLVQR